jgi:uncharacterized membrane-anchored protein YjiN (DUF445 family)
MEVALIRWTEEMWDIKDCPWKNDPAIFEEDLGIRDLKQREITKYFVYKVYKILDEKRFLENVVKYPDKILEYKIENEEPFGDAIDLLKDHPDLRKKFYKNYPHLKEQVKEDIKEREEVEEFLKKLDTSS